MHNVCATSLCQSPCYTCLTTVSSTSLHHPSCHLINLATSSTSSNVWLPPLTALPLSDCHHRATSMQPLTRKREREREKREGETVEKGTARTARNDSQAKGCEDIVHAKSMHFHLQACNGGRGLDLEAQALLQAGPCSSQSRESQSKEQGREGGQW